MAITEFPGALGVTVTQLLDRIRLQHLRGTQRPALNRLNGAQTTGQTTCAVEFTDNQPRAGDVLEIEDELQFCWTSGASPTVQRAFEGTTAINHPDDTLVELNPRYPRKAMLTTLLEEIESWPSSLYAVGTGSLTVTARRSAIDLAGASGLLGVRLLRLWRDQPGNAQPDWSRESWARVARARIEPRQDTTDFPSGYALVLPTEFDVSTPMRVAIGYRFPTSALVAASDLGTTAGLSRDLLDIAELGTAARLVTSKEISRNDPTAQGRSRRAEEVPAGTIRTIGLTLWELRNLRLGDAVKKLASEWGWSEETW